MATDTVLVGTLLSLLFDTVSYIRITRFDAASVKKTEAYRAEAGVE